MCAAPAGLGSLLSLADIGPDTDARATASRGSAPAVPMLRWRKLWRALGALALIGVLLALTRNRPRAGERIANAVAETTPAPDSSPSPAAGSGTRPAVLPKDLRGQAAAPRAPAEPAW
jgi:hypothetical protein